MPTKSGKKSLSGPAFIRMLKTYGIGPSSPARAKASGRPRGAKNKSTVAGFSPFYKAFKIGLKLLRERRGEWARGDVKTIERRADVSNRTARRAKSKVSYYFRAVLSKKKAAKK